MASAIEDGLKVRGCPAWSALDDCGWGSFAPAFGLIGVDRETFERAARPSAEWPGSLGRFREPPRTTGRGGPRTGSGGDAPAPARHVPAVDPARNVPGRGRQWADIASPM